MSITTKLHMLQQQNAQIDQEGRIYASMSCKNPYPTHDKSVFAARSRRRPTSTIFLAIYRPIRHLPSMQMGQQTEQGDELSLKWRNKYAPPPSHLNHERHARTVTPSRSAKVCPKWVSLSSGEIARYFDT